MRTCSTRARSTSPGSTTTAAGEWLPLVHGEGPLTEAYGFASQGEVLAKTRLAADAAWRDEDGSAGGLRDQPHHRQGLPGLHQQQRCARWNKPTLANPRPQNFAGHIIEISEDNGDHAATTFTWEIFILAGNPDRQRHLVRRLCGDEISPFAAPDNLTFDDDGNIWISTDGMANNLPGNDGLFAAPTEGEQRGRSMQFFSTVPGAECSGPVFNPDNTALWVSVQHPGEEGTLEEPRSLWPDGAGRAAALGGPDHRRRPRHARRPRELGGSGNLLRPAVVTVDRGRAYEFGGWGDRCAESYPVVGFADTPSFSNGSSRCSPLLSLARASRTGVS